MAVNNARNHSNPCRYLTATKSTKNNMATSCKRSSGALEVKDDTPQREEGVLHIPQKDVCGFIKQEKLRCILMLSDLGQAG